MSNSVSVVVCVEMVSHILGGQTCMASQKLAYILVTAVEALGEGVHLNAIASGQHHNFREIVCFRQPAQHLWQLLGSDGHPLKLGERSRPMITTNRNDRHSQIPQIRRWSGSLVAPLDFQTSKTVPGSGAFGDPAGVLWLLALEMESENLQFGGEIDGANVNLVGGHKHRGGKAENRAHPSFDE